MRHIEALLARHPPQMIQRMFSQTLESRRSSGVRRFRNVLNLNRSKLHIVFCIYEYHSHKLNFIVRLVVAISFIDSFDVLFDHWS